MIGAPASMTVLVDSYRNTYGWPFKNYDVGRLTFDQLTELYGEGATYISTPVGQVRNPWASIYLAIVKGLLDGNDLCFGTALASQRVKNNQWGGVNIADMPTTNITPPPFIWLNPGGMSPNPHPAPQDDFIHVQHIAQYSDEWLGYYLNNSLVGAGALRGMIETDLGGGDFPLVCIRKSVGDGHVLVAYDTEDDPAVPGGFIIDVYDPNEEFTSTEDGDGSGYTHQTAFQLSQVVVGADGSWTFPFCAESWPPPPGTSWSGDANSIIPGSSQIIPPIPSMPGPNSALVYALEGGAVAVFGSAKAALGMEDEVTVSAGVTTLQLSDAAGRTLLHADGSLNTNPATRVAAAPAIFTTARTPRGDIFVVGPGGSYTHTLRGKATGTYGLMMVGRPFGVVLTCGTAEGQEDAITLDTGGRALSFATSAASAALRAEVMMNGPDGSPVFATLLARAETGITHTLRFTANAASVVHETDGGAAPVEIYLSALNRQGRRHAVSTGPLTAGDGQLTTLTPLDWHDLGAVLLTQTGASRTRRLSAEPFVAHIG